MANASWRINTLQSGSLIFIKQMAALYNTKFYDGIHRVLEMNYTDLDITYQIELNENGSVVHEGTPFSYTPYTVWQAISRGELHGDIALMEQKYRVLGDFSLVMQWGAFSIHNSDKSKSTAVQTNHCAFVIFYSKTYLLPLYKLFLYSGPNGKWGHSDTHCGEQMNEEYFSDTDRSLQAYA